MLFTGIIAFVAGLILGFVAVFGGFSEQTVQWIGYLIGGSVGIVVGIWVLTLALRNTFSDFKIILVRPEPGDSEDDA